MKFDKLCAKILKESDKLVEQFDDELEYKFNLGDRVKIIATSKDLHGPTEKDRFPFNTGDKVEIVDFVEYSGDEELYKITDGVKTATINASAIELV